MKKYTEEEIAAWHAERAAWFAYVAALKGDPRE
jgi:hypothetical protein